MCEPEWFRDSIAECGTPIQRRDGEKTLTGLRWGKSSGRTAVLVHGGAAHAHWWDHIAPRLAARAFDRVVAIDLSGHGDSDWREGYSTATWAHELRESVNEWGGDRPIVIAHSLGGTVACFAAGREDPGWGGLIVVDSPIGRAFQSKSAEERRSAAPRRAYGSVSEAVASFRLLPAQTLPAKFVIEHIVRHGLRHRSDGWVWKFDPKVLYRPDRLDTVHWAEVQSNVRGRAAFIHGPKSRVADAAVVAMARAALGADSVVSSPGHHHLILEDAPAFCRAVEAIIEAW